MRGTERDAVLPSGMSESTVKKTTYLVLFICSSSNLGVSIKSENVTQLQGQTGHKRDTGLGKAANEKRASW